jgi:hypothetical protein
LENPVARNASELLYMVNVQPDESPKIEVEFLPDTAYFKFVAITGIIEDDNGFHSLHLSYEADGQKFSIPVPVQSTQRKQGFITQWNADVSKLPADEKLRIYMTVRDNDPINGYKAVQSRVFTFHKPSLTNLAKNIDEKSQRAEKQLDKSLEKTDELTKSLKELTDRLKTQKNMTWKDEQLIKETLQEKDKLNEMLKQLQEKNEELKNLQQNFEQSERMKEKNDQLDELMRNLMDEETMKLYEELKKLMEEKRSPEDIRKKLEQINRNENRLKKDMERVLELFKRQKMEAMMERTSQVLDKLAEKQDQLAEKEGNESKLAEQEKLGEEFEQAAKTMEEIEKLNQQLKNPEPLQDFDTESQDIRQEMQGAEQNMKEGNQKDSKQKQKNAAQKMKQLSQKMQKMQAGMEMEVMQENIQQLRNILDDLVRVSYRQEDLMVDFRSVSESDPRFITLSQDQLKLKDDIAVIQDSLLALASRVVQLSSFITREVADINMHLDNSVENLRERQRIRALANQQFAMTSMNNLALMLSDVLENMQMSMSESMGNQSKKQQQSMPLPSLSEMQQQLGEQIKKLQDGQKSGKELSEELARLAAEQEAIRQQLQELRESLDGQMNDENISNNLQKALQMMEQNEVDLVNKRISRQLIERQKEITTRMLEAQEALREQEQEPTREAETARDLQRLFPPNFEEYLKKRKKEIEMLRSVPVELKPFYKKEVNDYFRRLSEQVQ